MLFGGVYEEKVGKVCVEVTDAGGTQEMVFNNSGVIKSDPQRYRLWTED